MSGLKWKPLMIKAKFQISAKNVICTGHLCHDISFLFFPSTNLDFNNHLLPQTNTSTDDVCTDKN